MGKAKKQQKKSIFYNRIRMINGKHPFQNQVHGAFVSYMAFSQKRGRVLYFNFPLAREMGLLDRDHPNSLNPKLESILLDTFCLQIINEYDLINKKNQRGKDIKPHQYMATRYLQLQHPNKLGLTSGDGRSIWNGFTRFKGVSWDISSCGTGATCLSPATAIYQQYFQTGDPFISYGCGHSSVVEGITDVLFSEVLNRNNIDCERVLCVIELPNNRGITVRVGQNLLRPSHFFNHLKQGQYLRLKEVTDYYIGREVDNQRWQIPTGKNKYDYFLERMTETFATITAKFESHYIFCWLDWDGDNILADGGIIDFGSVRQFGLYYHQYRFDDDERWSTNIKEQKGKAIYIIQTFAQMVDYIKTGKKRSLSNFNKHRCLKRFDELYRWKKLELTLWRIGFTTPQIRFLMRFYSKKVKAIHQSMEYLQQLKSRGGTVRVPDGINCNILVNMRRLLGSYPKAIKDGDIVDRQVFVSMMESQFTQMEPIRLHQNLKKQIKIFQECYMALLQGAFDNQGISFQKGLETLINRSHQINRPDRITGDSICVVADQLAKNRKKMSADEFCNLLRAFTDQQVLDPDHRKSKFEDTKPPKVVNQKLLNKLFDILKDYREGL